MKLIDKDALVAEIERLKNTSLEYGYNTMQKVLADSGKDISLRQLQNFIDTLKVKEVDLELNSFDATVCKICNTYLKEMDKDAIVKALESYKDGDKVKVIIKAQKGE